jgi:ADP-heptose:LPS heptosyltransferase
VRFDVPERSIDASYVTQWIDANDLNALDFSVLNPGAGWPSKVWPADRYGLIARYLLDRWNLPSVAVWGSAAERPLAQAIVHASHGAAKLALPTNLGQLAALCRRSALFLGSDTGPMHLAVAVGTPTISMHGPSRAEWCGAYGEANVRLQAQFAAGSFRKRRRADNAAMLAISVDMVKDACERIFSRAEIGAPSPRRAPSRQHFLGAERLP